MKFSSRATPEGLACHMWPAGHGLSITGLADINGKPCKVSASVGDI